MAASNATADPMPPGEWGERPALGAAVAEASLRAADLSPIERRRTIQRARAEIEWWRSIDNPRDADERHVYVQRMVDSLQFFVDHELETYVHAAIDQQEELRRDEPTFCVLAGMVAAYSPARQAYVEALRHIDRAMRLEPDFAYARAADGFVRVLRQQGRAADGETVEQDDVIAALSNLARALSRRPELALARRATAAGYLLLGRARTALPHIDAAIALTPNDHHTWRLCVTALRDVAASNLAAELEHRLQTHGRELWPATRLGVYGLLADEYARASDHARAFDVLVLQALPIAHSHPDELTAAQWRALYVDAAEAAARSSQDVAIAFSFLDAALEHCRRQQLRTYPLVRPNEALLNALRRVDADREEIDRRTVRLLTLLLDVRAHDALNESQAREVVDVLSRTLRAPDVDLTALPLERTAVWQLARWLFERHETSHDENRFELAMHCLRAVLPVEPTHRRRPYPRAVLDAAGAADIRYVQDALIVYGLDAADDAVRQDSVHIVARLLRSQVGRRDRDRGFVAYAHEALEGRMNPAGLRRMVSVCEVMAAYPVAELAQPLVEAMKRATQQEDRTIAARLFAAAHAAMNALVSEPFEPAWRPAADTPVTEYERIEREWRARVRAAGASLGG